MPHQCTDCGRSFEDGSTEMLSGCPDCGGTTFQYRPEGADTPPDPAEEPPEPPDRPADSSVARTVGNAATAVRDFVGSGPPSPDTPESDPSTGSVSTGRPDPDPSPSAGDRQTQEDAAQASARSEVVSPEDLPQSTTRTERPTPVLDEDSESPSRDSGSETRPDLQTLREELNDQFESIKVLEPGQYELNLMELYDREEYIIALQEDGKYTIQVPERWKGE